MPCSQGLLAWATRGNTRSPSYCLPSAQQGTYLAGLLGGCMCSQAASRHHLLISSSPPPAPRRALRTPLLVQHRKPPATPYALSLPAETRRARGRWSCLTYSCLQCVCVCLIYIIIHIIILYILLHVHYSISENIICTTHMIMYIYNTIYDNAIYVYAIYVYDIGGCRGACRSPRRLHVGTRMSVPVQAALQELKEALVP